MSPIVWVWVIVEQKINWKKKVLIWKRLWIVWNWTYWFPGWKVEKWETIFATAKREVKEEANIEIKKLKLLGFTQDFFENWEHYITFFVWAKIKSWEVKNLEPQKCENWLWEKYDNLPEPLFLPIQNFKNQKNLL